MDYRRYAGLGRELVCINDGSYTRVNLSKCKYSVLDLTIVSENLACRCDWKVLNESTIGSDHFPVCSTIGVELLNRLGKNS